MTQLDQAPELAAVDEAAGVLEVGVAVLEPLQLLQVPAADEAAAPLDGEPIHPFQPADPVLGVAVLCDELVVEADQAPQLPV